MSARSQIFGIVNLTEDSFSDGGLYLAADAALRRARALAAAGANVVDLGAAASNPRARAVSPQAEIERLAPVVDALTRDGIAVSIDSFAPETQLWALSRGVAYLNDIHGFARPELYPELAASATKLVVMHALRNDGPARRDDETPPNLFERVLAFFQARIAALAAAGVARERLILDPGMGLFLGRSRAASFGILRRISEVKQAFRLPVLISVSRKSFLRPPGREPVESGAASLAAELFAAAQGVDFIRTHDPAALRDGLDVMEALKEGTPGLRQDLSVMMAAEPEGQCA
ncbi:MAG TPA: dihydropteroate synthase [Rhizomicrobium sp.]